MPAAPELADRPPRIRWGAKPDRYRVRAESGSNSLFMNEHELERIEWVRWAGLGRCGGRYGLSERVYAGALEHELRGRGHEVVRELMVDVGYRGQHVAWQRLDMVVDERVVVENKATEKLSPADRVQLVSYLRAISFAVGPLLHFDPTPRFERFMDYPKNPPRNTTRMISASMHAARVLGAIRSIRRIRAQRVGARFGATIA